MAACALVTFIVWFVEASNHICLGFENVSASLYLDVKLTCARFALPAFLRDLLAVIHKVGKVATSIYDLVALEDSS